MTLSTSDLTGGVGGAGVAGEDAVAQPLVVKVPRPSASARVLLAVRVSTLGRRGVVDADAAGGVVVDVGDRIGHVTGQALIGAVAIGVADGDAKSVRATSASPGV